MWRFVRSFLLFAILCSWAPAAGTGAQSSIAPSCANDILIAHPVPTSAGPPDAPLSALTMDGRTVASFPIDRPAYVTAATGTSRVLVSDSDLNLFVVDPSNGESRPIPIPDGNESVWQVDQAIPDSSLVRISSDGEPYLFDLDSGELFSISDRIDPEDRGIERESDPRVFVSNGAHLMVVESGGFLWAGSPRSHEPLEFLGMIEEPGALAFSPAGTKLIYEFVGSVDGKRHISVLDDHLHLLQRLDLQVKPAAFRFLDEDQIVFAMPADIVVIDYLSLVTRTFAIAGSDWLGPSSSAEDWIVLRVDGALQLLDMQSGNSQVLPQSEQMYGDRSAVANRAVFIRLGASGNAAGAIEFPIGMSGGNWRVTNFSDIFDLAGVTPDKRYGVGVYSPPGQWIPALVNLDNGDETHLSSTDVVPVIDISPSGCFAVGSIDIVDNLQDANIDVYRTDGTLVHHFDDVALLGWAPGVQKIELSNVP